MNNLFIKISLGGGALLGLLLAVFFVTEYAVGLHPLEQHKYLFLPILAVGSALVVKYFRDYKNAGILYGWQSITSAMLVNLGAGAVFSFLLWGYFLADEGLMKHHQEMLRERAAAGLAAVEDQKDVNLYKDILEQIDSGAVTPGVLALDFWLKTGIIGFVIAMAVGVIFRKHPAGIADKPARSAQKKKKSKEK